MKHLPQTLGPLFVVVSAMAMLAPTARAQQEVDPFAPRGGRDSDRSTGLIASSEFNNAEVTVVFKLISDATGWSIIASPAVTTKPPKVSVWIKNMTADQVLDRVVNLAGLVMDRKGNTVEVMTLDEYAQRKGLAKAIVQLENASAAEVARILQQFINPEQAKVIAHEPGNTIVVLAPPTLSQSLEQLAKTLDAPQAKDKVLTIKLEHLDAETIVPTLEQFLSSGSQETSRYSTLLIRPEPQALQRPAGQAPGAEARQAQPQQGAAAEGVAAPRAGSRWVVQMMPVSKLNAVVLRGLPSDVDRAAELIAALDVPTGVTTVAYQLRYTNASDAYETVREIVEADRGSFQSQRQSESRLRVAASMQNNRIIVEGSTKDQQRIAVLIEAIDQPLPAGSGGVRVYRLENASAEEVARVLQEMLAEESRQRLATQERTSTQQTSGPSYIRSRSSGSVGTLPPGASGPQARTQAAAATPVAGEQAASGGGAGDVLPVTVTAAPEINAVVIRAAAAQQEELADVIAVLDQPRDQVQLEVTLVLVRASDTFDLSVQLGGSRVGDVRTDVIGFSNFGIANIDPATGNMSFSAPPPFGANFGVFNAGDFSLVINALKTVGQTRITSQPKLVVQDNAQAQISQLNQEPFETVSQGQTSTLSSFGGFVDAGTSLTVTPHISNKGWLRMDYQVELSSFGVRTPEQRASNLPPPRQENTSSGTVRVPEDHMVVIGGLANSRDDRNRTGIPFLMDIPIIGEVFKSQSTLKTNDTLFIFIRPVVLKDPQFADLLFLSDEDLKRAKIESDAPVNKPKFFVPPKQWMEEEENQAPKRPIEPAPSNRPKLIDPLDLEEPA